MADIIIINPVVINYFLKSDQSWKEKTLDYKTFFDQEGKNESVLDLVEKDFLEPRHVLNCDFNDIMFLNISASDSLGNLKQKKSTYWDSGRCELQEYSEFNKEILKYKTLMISLQQIDNKQKNIVLRFDIIKNQCIPIMHIEVNEKDTELKSISLDEFQILIDNFYHICPK